MKFNKRALAATLAASTVLGASSPAWADAGGVAAGLFGGMVLGSAIRGSREQQQRQNYSSGYNAGQNSAPRTVVVQQPPRQNSAESRIRELDDMHNKGLITNSEYTSRKKAILDSL